MDTKIVFFDIDGTIYSYEKGIPKDTAKAIELLKANGHIPVICTGRTKCMIYPDFINLGFDNIIAGAGTYCETNGKELYYKKLEDAEARRVIDGFLEYGFFPLAEGKEYIFYGKVSGTLLRKEMSVPEFYPVSSAPSVCPIYRQTEGLSTRMISNAVKHALTLLPEQVKDPIPYDIRMQYHLCELRYALEQIHFPDSMESMKIAKKRLVFEELFTLQLGLLELKYRKKQETSLPPFIDYTNEFFRLLPFTPTGAQKRAISEVP